MCTQRERRRRTEEEEEEEEEPKKKKVRHGHMSERQGKQFLKKKKNIKNL